MEVDDDLESRFACDGRKHYHGRRSTMGYRPRMSFVERHADEEIAEYPCKTYDKDGNLKSITPAVTWGEVYKRCAKKGGKNVKSR